MNICCDVLELFPISVLLNLRLADREYCRNVTRAINHHNDRKICDKNLELYRRLPTTRALHRQGLYRAVLYKMTNTGIYLYDLNLFSMVAVFKRVIQIKPESIPSLPLYKEELREVYVSTVPELCLGKLQ
jgi:hypothetical protein